MRLLYSDDRDLEDVISWCDMQTRMYPDDNIPHENDPPCGHLDCPVMNRLRAVSIRQAAEVEAVLGQIFQCLTPREDFCRMTASALLAEIEGKLQVSDQDRKLFFWELDTIRQAVNRRNGMVHDRITMDYSSEPYRIGGGDEVLISPRGDMIYDELDLQADVRLQRNATQCAVEILYHLQECKHRGARPHPCAICGQE